MAYPTAEPRIQRPPVCTPLGDNQVAVNIEDFYPFSEGGGYKTISSRYGRYHSLPTTYALTPMGLRLNQNANNADKVQLTANENIKFIQVGLANDPPDDIVIPALGAGPVSTAFRAVASRYYASWPNYYGTILSISASGFWLSEWAGSALACRARYEGPIKAGDSIGVYAGGAGKNIIHLYLNGVRVSTNNATDKCYHAPVEFIGNGPGAANTYAYRGTLSYVATSRLDPAFGLAAALHQNPWQVFEADIKWATATGGGAGNLISLFFDTRNLLANLIDPLQDSKVISSTTRSYLADSKGTVQTQRVALEGALVTVVNTLECIDDTYIQVRRGVSTLEDTINLVSNFKACNVDSKLYAQTLREVIEDAKVKVSSSTSAQHPTTLTLRSARTLLQDAIVDVATLGVTSIFVDSTVAITSALVGLATIDSKVAVSKTILLGGIDTAAAVLKYVTEQADTEVEVKREVDSALDSLLTLHRDISSTHDTDTLLRLLAEGAGVLFTLSSLMRDFVLAKGHERQFTLPSKNTMFTLSK